MKELKYPEGSIISWCDEYYKVVKNCSDWSATVMDTAGDMSRNFYFNYCGEEVVLVTDEVIIEKVNNWIQEALNRKCIIEM